MSTPATRRLAPCLAPLEPSDSPAPLKPAAPAAGGHAAPPPRLALSVPDAAEACGVSERSLWRAIQRRELPSVQLGTRRLVRVADLERWLADHADWTGAA